MLSDLEEKRNLCGDLILQFGKGSKNGPDFLKGKLSRQMHDARINVESSVEASGAFPHGVLCSGRQGRHRAGSGRDTPGSNRSIVGVSSFYPRRSDSHIGRHNNAVNSPSYGIETTVRARKWYSIFDGYATGSTKGKQSLPDKCLPDTNTVIFSTRLQGSLR
jgi:hypothetical protein